MFDSRCKYLILGDIDTTSIIFPMYGCLPNVKVKRLHVPLYIYGIIFRLVHTVDFAICWIGGNLDFLTYVKTKNCIDYSRHRPSPVENSGMIHFFTAV